MGKRTNQTRSCKLREALFETETTKTTPSLRATPPARGIKDVEVKTGLKGKDKGQSSKDKG